MMRALLLSILLASCAPVPAEPSHETPRLPFRTCQALPVPLPELRTIEALKERHDRIDALYRDCAERLRLAVEAYDALKARNP